MNYSLCLWAEMADDLKIAVRSLSLEMAET